MPVLVKVKEIVNTMTSIAARLLLPTVSSHLRHSTTPPLTTPSQQAISMQEPSNDLDNDSDYSRDLL